MSIEGTIISNKKGYVEIKQFMTGDVYRCKLSEIKIRGKNNQPEKTSDGHFIAKVDAFKTELVRFGSEPKTVDHTQKSV